MALLDRAEPMMTDDEADKLIALYNRLGEQRAAARRRAERWKRLPLVVRGSIRTGRFVVRHRRPLAPFLTTAGTLTTAQALQIQGGWPAALGLAAAAAPELALRLRRRAIRRRKGARWPERAGRAMLRRRVLTAWGRLYTSAVYAAVFGWLLVSAATGQVLPPPGGLEGLGVAIGSGAVLGAPWWWHLARRRPEPEAPLGEHLQIWLEFVACQGGALPDSGLHNLLISNNDNWGADIELPRGKGTATAAMTTQIQERIASAYGVPAVSVNIDRHPSGNEQWAHIEVYERNPLQEVKEWEGPHLLDPNTGIAPIAVHPDGQFVDYRMWRPGSGPVHDLFVGSTDSGKSRLTEMCLAYERHTPHMVSWVIDPQHGQSLPDWQNAVDLFAGDVTEGLYAMRDAVDFMYDRNRRLADWEWVDDKGRERRGVAAFDPVKLGLPILSVTMEEAAAVFAAYKEVVVLAERFATMARKCGGKLRIVMQNPSLGNLGGSNTLREQLAAGNVVVMRTGGRMSGQLALQGSMPVEPHKIPKQWPNGDSTAGLAYASVGSARATLARTFLCVDPFHWASTGETTTFNATEAARLGDGWRHWRQRRDDRKAGRPVTEPGAGKAAAETAAQGVAKTEAAAAAAETAVPRSSSRADILAHLRANGRCTNQQIINALGMKSTTVNSSLTRMEEDGQVRRVEKGVWEAAMASAAVA
ncbi:winged helix-turn-helix domain-containing protein [Actinacidiphila sp. bgisy160]|uniref:winged helix-turn-helix domain-containing protein n=1 Tax=Actinacidiphila sp. bgisy160 TaxID=3413796 RepID=UPI003D74F014